MSDQLQRLTSRFLEMVPDGANELGPGLFLALLLLSVMAAIFVSFLYLQFYSGRPTGSQIHRAFPLLGLAITAIFICIQFSLPLSLGLLGALSIVRFRTPIKEPEEIGFLMLLIATSLACATFNLYFLAIILLVAVIALVLRRFAPAIVNGPTSEGTLIFSVPESQYVAKQEEILDLLKLRLNRGQLDSVSQNEQNIVLSLSFKSMQPRAIAAVEGDLRKLVEPSGFTVFFNRAVEL